MNTRSAAPPPKTEAELLDRSRQLAGKTLGQLAALLNCTLPQNQKRAKGWIGEAMEAFLGATAASLPEPDFQEIGVELKTLPVNANGRPKESTYVCTVPLTDLTGLSWQNSIVKKKLNRVLWVPVEADPAITFSARRIGDAFLWSPDEQQVGDLRNDWEELMDMISMGELDRINSQYGKVMQIRPKGMNAKALTKTDTGLTLPRGFYLRSSFTHQILVRSKE